MASSSESALEWAWQRVKPLGMAFSGALFGLGWFCAADALCRSAFVLRSPVPAAYAAPGAIASLALLVVACVRRSDVSGGGGGGYGGYGDEGAPARARCALFFGYALSFGAVSAAVVELCLAKQRGDADMWAPSAIVVQTALIAAAAMLAFVSRDGDDGDEFGYGGF